MRLATLLLLFAPRDLAGFAEESVSSLHRHTAEVGDEVCAVRVTCNVALGATPCVLAAEGKHIATVAAPVCADVVDGFKAVGDAVIDLLRVVFLYKRAEMRDCA